MHIEDMADIEDRDWNAWVVPAELQDRGIEILTAALREIGADVEAFDWRGIKRFWCYPSPCPEMMLQAVNIARLAIGVPTFDSVEERNEFDAWLVQRVQQVA